MDKAIVPHFLLKIGKRAPSFTDLARLAMHDLEALNGRAEIVCGPITTGGYNNSVMNTLAFNYAIEMLLLAGRPMFSQMPYEAGLADLEHEWKLANPAEKYCHPILTEFYYPLFNSGLIRRAWFLPDWETSTGARMEHERFVKLNVPIVYLDREWMFGIKLPPDLD